MSRDKLVAYLWPEDDARSARHLLADSVYVLRKHLGKDAVFAEGDTLALNRDAVRTDLDEFESALGDGDLERAVAAYRGPFLDGFFLGDSVEFEHWVDEVRARLARRYKQVLEELASERGARRDRLGAVEAWRRLAAHDPYDSRVALELMGALEASGDRAGALQHAEAHQRLLREEFGAEPDPAVEALAERLRRHPHLSDEAMPAVRRRVRRTARPEADAPQRKRSRRILAWAGAGLALLVAAGITYSRLVDTQASSSDTIESIAVLPFADMSPAGDQEYFSDGLSEEILNALAQVQGLKVVGRTSSFQFKGREVDVREVGEALGVEAVLEGSVRKSGDRLRISAQLLNAESGFHLWSQTYDRGVADLLVIQEEIARSVTEALRLRLPGGSLARGGTTDMDAYDLYLRGRNALRPRSREGMERALEYFRAAIARDPNFAEAHAGIADASTLLVSYRYDPPEKLLPLARRAAEQALALDEGLAEAHASLGLVDLQEKRWDASIRELRRAIELNPSYVLAYQWLGVLYNARGDSPKAVREFRRAIELDPLAIPPRRGYTTALILARDYGAARSEATQLTHIAPDDWGGWVLLSKVLEMERREMEAVEAGRRAVELAPGQPQASAQLATAYIRFGEEAKAREILAKVEKAQPACSYCVGKIYAALGDRDRAFLWLDRAIDDPADGFFPIDDPAYDSLRGDPRYERLLQKWDLGRSPPSLPRL